ncbi:LTA synthase family protein [Sphingobacterium sp. SGG-5]|uniref:LTA synthase family protein n=1 Tax=Sphingobacterium sp. SGG-5 TaxID=2710881 RepID=UPI0013E9B050|nr:LTA synthase family protein [Sphingobacterium sp. SGG-5]NGM61195.1 LTA synthase family protein [Sphingobacterium sp. SGG-5]
MKVKGYLGVFLMLALQFVGLLFLYFLLRLGFYALNKDLFAEVDMPRLLPMLAGGVRFDIVALLYLNILYILWWVVPLPFKFKPGCQRFAKYLFVVTNAIGVALNLIDMAYYPFTLKRTTATVVEQFKHETNYGQLLGDFLIEYWFLLIVFVGLIYALLRLVTFFKVVKPALGWKFYAAHTVGMLAVTFLFIGGVRGGWAHSTRPITLSNAGDYVQSPEEMSIVLNTPFAIMKTLEAVYLREVHYYTPQELHSRYPVIHVPQDSIPFRKLNVVFLIMESFGKENIGFYNKDINGGTYKGYTPFLDSLIAEAYTFRRSYANGRKSIDALPSVISSIPSIGEPFVLSVYSGNKTTSIAKLLGDAGYETAFFHGAPNGSMGFSAYTQLAGIQHYFGKDEYGNDDHFDGIWGIWDEPFMQFMARKLDTFQEPFFASFFSLSSHHPFKVPEKYKGKFPKGPLPLHEPTGYSDYALRQFFDKAANSPWYKNTLFVICADHSSQSYLPEYQTLPNQFAIPIIFYYPGGNLHGLSDKLIQQIDIMPTVLNYLGYDKPYFSFGFDAFNTAQENFLVNNIGGSFNFYRGDYFMTYDGEKPTSLFNLRKDKGVKENLLDQDKAMQDTLVSYMRAFIQQYNYRMIHNELVAE